MADGNPQLEEGYLRAANELAEAIARSKMNGQQARLMWWIARNTYGRKGGQKSYKTTYAAVARGISTDRRQAIRVCKLLSDCKVVGICTTPQGITIGINKHYQEWRGVGNSPPVGKCTTPVGNSPLELVGSSTTDYKKKKLEESNPPITPLPEVDPEIWADFVQLRKEIKHPLTETAEKRIVAKLSKFVSEGFDPNEALLTSIENNWRGVFEPKGKRNGPHQQASTEKTLFERQLDEGATWLREQGLLE